MPTQYIETARDGADARAELHGEFDMNATFSVEPALEQLLAARELYTWAPLRFAGRALVLVDPLPRGGSH